MKGETKNIRGSPMSERLGLFNNDGVERSAVNGDSFLPEAALTADIRYTTEPQGLRVVKSRPETRDVLTRQTDGMYRGLIAPGGFCIRELHPAESGIKRIKAEFAALS